MDLDLLVKLEGKLCLPQLICDPILAIVIPKPSAVYYKVNNHGI